MGEQPTQERLYLSSHDSSLEQAGFEPSVPRDTTNFKEAAVCHLRRLPDFAPTEVSARTKGGRSNYAGPEKSEIRRCVKWLTHRTGSERLFGAPLSEVSGASAIRRAPCRDMTFGSDSRTAGIGFRRRSRARPGGVVTEMGSSG